jgi:hypothetical protein
MQCHSRYPEGFPKVCLEEARGILRAGNLFVRTAEFAEHVWNVEGWVRGETIGRAQTKADGAHGADQLPRAEALELLAAFLNEFTAAAGAGPENPPSWVDRGKVEWVQNALLPGLLAVLALLDRPAKEPEAV